MEDFEKGTTYSSPKEGGKSLEQNSIAEEVVREVQEAEPVIDWGEDEFGLRVLKVELPYGCFIRGIQIDQTSITVENFQLGWQLSEEKRKEMREHGIGSRLLRLFAAEALKQGISRIEGAVTRAALRTRARVFGEASLTLKDAAGKSISFDEAMKQRSEERRVGKEC